MNGVSTVISLCFSPVAVLFRGLAQAMLSCISINVWKYKREETFELDAYFSSIRIMTKDKKINNLSCYFLAQNTLTLFITTIGRDGFPLSRRGCSAKGRVRAFHRTKQKS